MKMLSAMIVDLILKNKKLLILLNTTKLQNVTVSRRHVSIFPQSYNLSSDPTNESVKIEYI